MKKGFTKVMLLVLCLAMVLSSCMALASCGKKENVPEKPDANGDLPNEEVEGEKVPELPDKKFNKDFVVLTDGKDDFWVENAESGDIVDYALYMRNSSTEEKFGVKIKPVEKFYADIPGLVADYIKAGDSNAVDLVSNHIVVTSDIVLAGNAKNWYEVPYINLNDEWWPDTNVNDLTLNGQAYLCMSNIALSNIGSTMLMYFDKKSAETYNLGDLYKIVDDGKWTFDKLVSLSKTVYSDLNHNNRKDRDDLYGLRIGSFVANTALIYGMDNHVFTKNPATGEMKCTFYSTKTAKILKDMVETLYKTDGVFYPDGEGSMKPFIEGRAVFVPGNLGQTMSELRDKTDWGILPRPKYNEKQKYYETTCSGAMDGFLIPKLGTDPEKYEKTGAVLTDLAYKSNKDLLPVYYNKALKGKYSEGPEEAKMIDLIMSVRYVDFGYIYLGFKGPMFGLQNMIQSKNTNLSSYWAGHKSELNDVISKAYEAFGLTFEGLE